MSQLNLMSEEWAAAFAAEANSGPDASRRQNVEENYWQWIEARKPNLNIVLGLAIKSDTDADLYSYFRIQEGVIVETWCDKGERRGEAQVVLGGTAEDWEELLRGPRNLSQNIMYRRLRLFQGNLHFFFRNIYYFAELLRQGMRVPAVVQTGAGNSAAEAAAGS
ncbi:hypothetical protein [Alicyclobacillus ferrooxydans]|uniref:SCP2 domain-containing protein n=1 Tax=Alicyclobacillus ferrooxydans TaxID=471514 RepID=A0A0P9EYR3_9BACL|nr:hypothetical protein [Alicyclobacillus ferrooxydans]KPV44268.1 hypothetical protein AN477_08215 [Alicyclobacillus ferrooxydans]